MEIFSTFAVPTVKINCEWNNPCDSLLVYVDQNDMKETFAEKNINGVYDFMTIGEVKELIIYQHHWPFLDDFVPNIQMNKLPKRSSHPTITISKHPKDFIIPDQFPYNSYKILDKEFIEAFFGWVEIDGSRLAEYKTKAWQIRLTTGRYKEPFGVIQLGFGTLPTTLNGYSNLLESFNESTFSLETFNALTRMQTWLELIPLPYNYGVLFDVIEEAKTNKIGIAEKLYAYLKSIPSYYRNYIKALWERVYMWNVNFSDMVFEDSKVSETLINEIKTIKIQAMKLRNEKEMLYQDRKKLHSEGKCCKLITAGNVESKQLEDNIDYSIFKPIDPISLLLHSHHGLQLIDKEIESATENKEPILSKGNVYERAHVNLPIAEMGNYMLCLENKKKLRDPHLSDEENARLNEVYFGNPYKRRKVKKIVNEKKCESEFMASESESIPFFYEDEISKKGKLTDKH